VTDDTVRSLGLIVGQEARRVLTDAQLRPDPKRLAAGWERRFVTDASRIDEMVQLYEELGYEVVADPIRTEDLDEDCEDCQLLALRQFRMLYTRPRGERQ
jgi:hypothetical protein